MKSIKTILILTFIAVGLLGVFDSAFAQAEPDFINVSYWNGSNYEELDGQALFNETNFMPGDTATSAIKIDKKISSSTLIQIHGEQTLGADKDPNLADALLLKISNKNNEEVYYGGSEEKTLSDFFNNSDEENGIELSTIPEGNNQSVEYLLSVTFAPSSSNKYQEKELKFDFDIGFFGEITSNENNTEGDDSGGGGGGFIPVTGTTINIINVGHEVDDLGGTGDISWNTTDENDDSLKTYGAIVYGTESVSSLGSYPRYGYDARVDDENEFKTATHTVTISGLEAGITYYYRVIAWSSPERVSPEGTFTIASSKEREEESTEETGQVPEDGIAIEPGSEEQSDQEAGEGTDSGPQEEQPEQQEEPSDVTEEGEEQDNNLGLAALANFLQDPLNCVDCISWALILLFALYFASKALQSWYQKRKEPRNLLRKYHQKRSIIWLTASLVTLLLSLWQSGACLPIWFFLIMAILTLSGVAIDSKITEIKVKESKNLPRSRVLWGLALAIIAFSIGQWMTSGCLIALIIFLYFVVLALLDTREWRRF